MMHYVLLPEPASYLEYKLRGKSLQSIVITIGKEWFGSLPTLSWKLTLFGIILLICW